MGHGFSNGVKEWGKSENWVGGIFLLSGQINKCLKESSFPDCWNVSPAVLVFKNVGKVYG